MFATPIKEEIEEKVHIDLVHDVANESDIDKLTVDDNSPREDLMLAITQPALVYTTKLEDMKILQKDFNEYNTKDIIQMLLAESKPKYSSNTPAPSSTHSETDLLSYMKVVRITKEINYKARLEIKNTRQRNLKLLKQCIPCSVILHDINKNPLKIEQKHVNESKTMAMSDSTNEDEIPLMNIKSAKTDSLKATEHRTVLLVLVQHNNEIADVYRFNIISKLVTNYYVITDYNENKLSDITYPKEPRNIRHYCCWYNREAVIEKLSLEKIHNKKNVFAPIKLFLKQPHGCHPGSCLCCCYVDKIKSDKTKHSQQSRYEMAKRSTLDCGSLEKQSSKSHSGDLIRKAVYYSPKMIEEIIPIEKEKEQKYTAFILLRIEKKDSELHVPIEFYVIGKGDNIIDSFTVYEKETAEIMEITYISMRLPVVKKLYCCWYSRENLISCLRIQKFSANVLKFLRTPHDCEINKCKCCCKTKIRFGSLQKRIQARQWTYTHWPAILNLTTAYNKNPTHVTIPSAAKTAPTKSNKKKQVAKPTVPTVCKQHVNEMPPHTIQPLIEEDNINILNKFKKLKISVNSEGELEAVLDSPAKDLSIVELKVLHHILTLSSKQIEQMNISPAEFCRRVNSKQTKHPNKIEAIASAETTAPIIQVQKEYNPPQKIHSQSNVPTNAINYNVPATLTEPTEPDIYEELSQIMRRKNSHLAVMFLTNYKLGSFAVMPYLPKFRIFPRVFETTVMPKVASTFSLLNWQGNVHPKIASVTSLAKQLSTPQRKITCDDSAGMLPQKATVNNVKRTYQNKTKVSRNMKQPKSKRKASSILEPDEKRIRVKPPSELNLDVAQTFPNIVTEKNMLFAPNPYSPTPIIISSGYQNNAPTYLVSNNMNSQNLATDINNTQAGTAGLTRRIIIAKRMEDPKNTDGNTNTDTAQNSTPPQGTQWMTFGPMPSAGSSGFGELLSKMLQTPHVHPNVSQCSNVVPPLVPIGSSTVKNFTSSSDATQSTAVPNNTLKGKKRKITDATLPSNAIPSNSAVIKATPSGEKLIAIAPAINKVIQPNNVTKIILEPRDGGKISTTSSKINPIQSTSTPNILKRRERKISQERTERNIRQSPSVNELEPTPIVLKRRERKSKVETKPMEQENSSELDVENSIRWNVIVDNNR